MPSSCTSPGHGDDSILKDQFNPFLRETIPPLLVEAYAEGDETWYGCVVTRAWTTIRVRLLDVAPYTVTLRVLDNGAVRRFSGTGDQWFVAEIDIDYWSDTLVDYTVRAEAVDSAGNALNPPWEQKIEGFFGRLIDLLCSIGAFIADVVVKALSFIVDLMLDVVRGIMDAVVAPIWNAFDG